MPSCPAGCRLKRRADSRSIGSSARTDDCTRSTPWTPIAPSRGRARSTRPAWSTGPLHGVPIALKDNIAVAGAITTAGSRILENYVSPFNATVVDKLERAGAVIVGKTDLRRIRHGLVHGELRVRPVAQSLGHRPRARRIERRIGGRGGGRPDAARARLGHRRIRSASPPRSAALSGSSRPTDACRATGSWPTPRHSIRLDRLRGRSPTPRCASRRSAAPTRGTPRPDPAPVPAFSEGLTGDIAGVRIGVPRHLLTDGVDSEVRTAFASGVQTLERLGATLVDIELPHARFAIPTYYLVATAEASSNLARYDGVRYGFRAPDAGTLEEMYDRTRDQGFGAEVKRRIMLGTYVLSAGYYDAYYLKALQVRTLIRQDYQHAFERVDAVALPTTPTPAFRLGERTEDPLQMYLADVFTVSAPLSGLPAISVPCGFTPDELPVGLQLTGRAWDEMTLLRVADAFERATEWTGRHPTL